MKDILQLALAVALYLAYLLTVAYLIATQFGWAIGIAVMMILAGVLASNVGESIDRH